jgi:hypothetical protein
MNRNYQDREGNLEKFQLSLYVLPVVGIIPAIKNLSSNPSDITHKKLSRLSLNLFFFWIVSYSILSLGANTTSELISLKLMYLNGMLTTGYFLTCLLLMFKIWLTKK